MPRDINIIIDDKSGFVNLSFISRLLTPLSRLGVVDRSFFYQVNTMPEMKGKVNIVGIDHKEDPAGLLFIGYNHIHDFIKAIDIDARVSIFYGRIAIIGDKILTNDGPLRGSISGEIWATMVPPSDRISKEDSNTFSLRISLKGSGKEDMSTFIPAFCDRYFEVDGVPICKKLKYDIIKNNKTGDKIVFFPIHASS